MSLHSTYLGTRYGHWPVATSPSKARPLSCLIRPASQWWAEAGGQPLASLQTFPNQTPSLPCPEGPATRKKGELSVFHASRAGEALLPVSRVLQTSSMRLEGTLTVRVLLCRTFPYLLPCSPTPPDVECLRLPVHALCPPVHHPSWPGLFFPSNIRGAAVVTSFLSPILENLISHLSFPSSPVTFKASLPAFPKFIIVDIQTPQQATASVDGLMKQPSFPTGLRTHSVETRL